MKKLLFGIPEHTNCRNCGVCCKEVPMTLEEITLIKTYVNSLPKERRSYIWSHIKGNEAPKCQFRDDIDQKCVVYPVRPAVCQIYGVVLGPKCKYGNSNDLIINELLTREYVYAERFMITGMVWEEE